MSLVISVHLSIVRCHHRVEESLSLEAEKPTVGSLQLMSALQIQRLRGLWQAA